MVVIWFKHCSKCHTDKENIAFGFDRKTKDRLNRWCKDCVKAASARWRNANPGQVTLQHAKWAVNDWAKRNPEARKEVVSAYNRRNRKQINTRINAHKRREPAVQRFHTAKRRAQKHQATPLWADQRAIKKIYQAAAKAGLEVDHIVPLMGKNVCGLHVETNLQLLSRAANIAKGNRV